MFKKAKFGTKAWKKRIMNVIFFDSKHSAVNARLKMSDKKQLSDFVLSSTKIRLSQSSNIILENRDTE